MNLTKLLGHDAAAALVQNIRQEIQTPDWADPIIYEALKEFEDLLERDPIDFHVPRLEPAEKAELHQQLLQWRQQKAQRCAELMMALIAARIALETIKREQ